MSKFDKNFNLLAYFALILAFLGSLFLAWNQVQAGMIYTLMMIGTIALIFLSMLFVKDDKDLPLVTRFVKIPLTTSLPLACTAYLIGRFLPIIGQAVTKLFKMGINFTSFSIPLFGSQIQQSFQSLSTASIGQSMPWKLFTIVDTAGALETFTFNLGAVIFGVLIAILITRLATGKKNIKKYKTWIKIGAITFATIMFMLSHQLNDTYQGAMFLIAGIFMLISNASIYFYSFIFMFWLGFHQSNNLVYLVRTEGIVPVLKGFVSWYGLISIGLLILILYYTLSNTDRVQREIKQQI